MVENIHKKINIILTDDWELPGNGLGNVYEKQEKTSKKLIDVYSNFGIKSTFNVEVMQQIAHLDNENDQDQLLKDNIQSWERSVKFMQDSGHDIQLHIHPQWYKAKFEDGYWHLGRQWNIGDYEAHQIDSIFDLAVSFFKSSFNKNPLSFRAGAWGLMPQTLKIFENLIKHNIKFDISLCEGIFYDGESISLDYLKLDSPSDHYYPNFNDPRKKTFNFNKIIEIPTQSAPRRIIKKNIFIRALRFLNSKFFYRGGNKKKYKRF